FWDFSAAGRAPAAPQGSAKGNESSLNLGAMNAKSLKLNYKDAKTGKTATVGAKSLDVKFDGPLSGMVITRVDLADGTIAVKDGKTSTTATIGKFTMDAKGKISDLGITNIDLSDTRIAYAGEGAPVEAVFDKLSLDKDGALQINGKVNGEDMKGKGSLAPVAVLVALNKPFPVKLSLDAMGLKVETDLQVTVVNNRPQLKGTVSIPEFTLSAAAQGKGGPAKAGVAGGAASSQIFPETPLPWDELKGGDADVKLSLGKVTMAGGMVATNVVLPINLAGGKLAVAPFTLGLAGGTLTGDLHANAADKSVALKVEGKGFTAEGIAKEMKKGDMVTGGPVDLQLNVRGSGNSLHAVAGTLDGSFVAGMGEGKIRRGALNMAGADILGQVASAITPMASKSEYTAAKCAVVNFVIANGVATTNNGIAFVSDEMQVTSSGTINLGTERVDLSVRPKARGGIGVGLGNLAQAVKIQGPLARPGIGIDKAGAVRTLGTLGMAFATGGGSILAQGAKDRLDSGDPCQAARTWNVKK
ncbi:MAG: AsmA family protein, partial [Rhodospirillaceae bacterium]